MSDHKTAPPCSDALAAQANSPVWLLNAPIITADGLFRSTTITRQHAAELVQRHGFRSAIGHAPTAAIVSDLLAIACPMNRVEFRQKAGQHALVFNLHSRLEEGRVLQNRDEIEQIGYSFLLLTREA